MRQAVRTVTLSLDQLNRILSLFGTIMNAYRQLGLVELGLTYPQFYRGMHFETITPVQKEQIEAAWARWCYLYLRSEVPPSSDLTITAMNRDAIPTWHPEHEAEDEEEEAGQHPAYQGRP